MAGGLKSITRSLPFKGINSSVPLLNLTEEYASGLTNFYFTDSTMRLRGGCTAYGNAIAGDERLVHLYKHIKLDGTEILVAIGGIDCREFYTVSGTGAPSSIVGGTAITGEFFWTSLMMNNITLFFNGVDIPKQYNGSGNISDATYTGSGLDQKTLRQATNYRDRIYIIQRSSFNLWYGASNALTGALTKFDLSYIFRKGGQLTLVATWSVDDGGGLDDRLVIGSSEGEIVVYAGSYPGGQDWYKVGHFFFPNLLGFESSFNLAGDLYLTTKEDIISLRSALEQGSTNYSALTSPISAIWRSYTSSYSSDESQWRIKAVLDPQINSLVINMPFMTEPFSSIFNLSSAVQFVMNLRTNAWSIFDCPLIDIECLKTNTIISTYKNKFATMHTGFYDYASDGHLDKAIYGNAYFAPILFNGSKKARYFSVYVNCLVGGTTYYYYPGIGKDLNDYTADVAARTIGSTIATKKRFIYGANGASSIFSPFLYGVTLSGTPQASPAIIDFYSYELQYSDMGGL